MENQLLFQSKTVTIEFDAENNWIYANWKGYQSLESVQEGCYKILEFMKSKTCSKVLNNNTEVTGTFTKASEWGASVWFPEMVKAGLKQFSWIYSADVFSKFSAQKAVEQTKDSPIKVFGDFSEAVKWLKAA